MPRHDAIERPRTDADDPNVKRFYNLFDVCPNGFVENGVKHSSWVVIYLAERTAQPVKLRLGMPGREQKDLALEWGQKHAEAIPDTWDLVGDAHVWLDVYADVDVHMQWVENLGKA